MIRANCRHPERRGGGFAYGAQTPRVQRLFGEAINTEFTVDGVAPYYRLALEPSG